MKGFSKRAVTYKNFIRLLLACAVLFGAFRAVFPPKRSISPVILLINRYPLQEDDKRFLKAVNPYGFLLSIPIHPEMNTLELKKELEEVLERKDFLFFIDQEGGSVNRLKHFVSGFDAPAPQMFGELAKTDLNKAVRQVHEYGLRTGRALKELGIDVVLSPMAETASGDDIFLRSRYFSTDPVTAKALADAFAQGLDEGGVTPCYKHFPGAPSSTDAHTTAQRINASIETLRAEKAPLFANAARWNCIMTAHAVYPALDEKNASAYSPAFYRFLRKEIPFEGLILPDALNMESAEGGSFLIGARMNKALAAGADAVMPFFSFSEDPKFMENEIRLISPVYVKRFQKRAGLLKRRN